MLAIEFVQPTFCHIDSCIECQQIRDVFPCTNVMSIMMMMTQAGTFSNERLAVSPAFAGEFDVFSQQGENLPIFGENRGTSFLSATRGR